MAAKPINNDTSYVFPTLDLLKPAENVNQRQFESNAREQCRKIEQTLADFRVSAKVIGVTRGPSVTRYVLEPAPGVKVSSIVNLKNEIAFRLAAPGIRVEAPIPGKAAIGIEVPNKINDIVSFREIVDCEDVRKNPSKLCVGLGKDIEGRVIPIDLAKADVEDAILRLAQKARACGIHMVLATQRPSVDVITGILKANIPSRIAFAVNQVKDSHTIIDMDGAEKLLGKGDMLYYPIGANKPFRVKGSFIGNEERNRVIDFVKQQNHWVC